jgi:transposase
VYSERLNATGFVTLLRHFMRRRKGRVFLVLDRHPAHIAKVATAYVQSLRGRLELHFLPGYAPELNPDEFVWNHLKRQGVSKKPLRKHESLRARVKGAKGRRQLIFVTHNPNIPVLGDAQRVVVLQSTGRRASVKGLGTVDEVKGEIETILEGGREAFQRRKERYGY